MIMWSQSDFSRSNLAKYTTILLQMSSYLSHFDSNEQLLQSLLKGLSTVIELEPELVISV